DRIVEFGRYQLVFDLGRPGRDMVQAIVTHRRDSFSREKPGWLFLLSEAPHESSQVMSLLSHESSQCRGHCSDLLSDIVPTFAQCRYVVTLRETVTSGRCKDPRLICKRTRHTSRGRRGGHAEHAGATRRV